MEYYRQHQRQNTGMKERYRYQLDDEECNSDLEEDRTEVLIVTKKCKHGKKSRSVKHMMYQIPVRSSEMDRDYVVHCGYRVLHPRRAIPSPPPPRQRYVRTDVGVDFVEDKLQQYGRTDTGVDFPKDKVERYVRTDTGVDFVEDKLKLSGLGQKHNRCDNCGKRRLMDKDRLDVVTSSAPRIHHSTQPWFSDTQKNVKHITFTKLLNDPDDFQQKLRFFENFYVATPEGLKEKSVSSSSQTANVNHIPKEEETKQLEDWMAQIQARYAALTGGPIGDIKDSLTSEKRASGDIPMQKGSRNDLKSVPAPMEEIVKGAYVDTEQLPVIWEVATADEDDDVQNESSSEEEAENEILDEEAENELQEEDEIEVSYEETEQDEVDVEQSYNMEEVEGNEGETEENELYTTCLDLQYVSISVPEVQGNGTDVEVVAKPNDEANTAKADQ